MDIILTAAIALAVAVTGFCASLQKSASEDDNHEYDRFLDENEEHVYYDRTSIRYRKGNFKDNKENK